MGNFYRQSRIKTILSVMEDIGPDNSALTPVKQKLPDDYSFNEIRAVMHYRERQQAKV